MKNNRLILILWLLLGSIVFVACDGCVEEDGKWDPIQITVNGNKCKSSTFQVPASGGEFRIYSKNYGSLWLLAVRENGDVVWPENYELSDFKNIHLTKEWYEVQYDESGNIVVNIQPKEKSVSPRTISFEVECGDAFGSITLSQE